MEYVARGVWENDLTEFMCIDERRFITLSVYLMSQVMW